MYYCIFFPQQMVCMLPFCRHSYSGIVSVPVSSAKIIITSIVIVLKDITVSFSFPSGGKLFYIYF